MSEEHEKKADIEAVLLKQILESLKRQEEDLGIIREEVKEIKEFQDLIVLKPMDVAKLFNVDKRTVNNWLKKYPHLTVKLDGNNFITMANLKLIIKLFGEKYKLREDNLPYFIKKMNSPTIELLKEYIFNQD